MDFKLSDDQEFMRKAAREFAEGEIRATVAERDEHKIWPTDIVQKMGQLGFMGVAIDEAYGGAGLDYVSYAIMIEELSRVDASVGVIASVNNSLVCAGIEKFGTEEQKRDILAPLASGQKLGAFSLSEPGAGSDAAAQKTRAVEDGDYYIITGTKNWVTNGSKADTILLMTMTAPEKGVKGITAFLIDTHEPGVSILKVEDKLGIRSAQSAQMSYDGYRVHKSRMLGQPGEGFKIAMTILNGGRIGIASQALGIAQGAYEAALDYAKVREQFGQSIINFQAVGFTLADMATRIKAARMLTYHAAWLKDQGENYIAAAAMAKVYASETAMWTATKAVQIFGSNGYSKEYPVERYFRDAKITEIYEGTSEIQRLVISREIAK
ncbi:MAG TPA: acyl-CoA dehydrogenase [Herpetosiphon sp.]|uniref:Acyl-CoA dehydrogenase domain protein n=1 Tax=Herpetosiphon aurantiacus (strain ATCC 23779 / DSM 785 / 114-95) TaxID=316274 RepID=A9B0M3_HERA2|nr:acyl-CoA dehydrogenase family protein [Herpetosiphon sp.]ABX07241.1 acyl-CoA dehydrogenase domain protein [Herpetosiphon aurantiacus DSM 785]MCA0355074.1 acyl-CoA dehydrogenase family protein [Chloroflexota bacterium]HBW52031.1 acyl-CoA dehydrogenase [Herpetosiphon sp.]